MEEFDENQDIARSSYADMLNDDERNKLYNIAIEISVKALVKSSEHNPHGDRFFQCCDIGTGSGLLAMMVARAFKDLDYYNFHITAFEAFKPMAQCAQKVIEVNDFRDFITVLPIRSDKFQGSQFDLLVAELLDTELIGEDCLSYYRHAVENFCSPTCLFVPHQARIYIEPVASKLLFERSSVEDFEVMLEQGKKVSVQVPDEIKNCSGFSTVDDLQASALRPDIDFKRFTKPRLAFTFTFNESSTLSPQGVSVINFPVEREITEPIVVIMWWDIVMYDQVLTQHPQLNDYGSKYLLLSCAPRWARSESLRKRDDEILREYGRRVWREHWIQGVYYMPSVADAKNKVRSNLTEITIHAYHDSCSLAFDVNPIGEYEKNNYTCHCEKHRLLSRSQLAFISDNDGLKKLLKSALYHTTQFPVKATLEIQRAARNFGEEQAIGQQVNWRIILPDCDDLYDINFQREYSWEQVLRWFFTDCPIDPVESFEIKCTQVEFENLNRICTRRDSCEGFNLKPLDEMIKKSSDLVDEVIDHYYLWEYDCTRLDLDHTVYSSTFHQKCVFVRRHEGPDQWSETTLNEVPPFWRNFRFQVNREPGEWQKGWALVFWTEFKLKNTNEIFSTGPLNGSTPDEYIEWNRYCPQSVYFMHDHPFERQPVDIDVGLRMSKTLGYSLSIQRAVDYNTVPTSLRTT